MIDTILLSYYKNIKIIKRRGKTKKIALPPPTNRAVKYATAAQRESGSLDGQKTITEGDYNLWKAYVTLYEEKNIDNAPNLVAKYKAIYEEFLLKSDMPVAERLRTLFPKLLSHVL